MKNNATIAAILLALFAGPSMCEEVGVIRTVEDVLEASHSVLSVTIDRVESQKCSKPNGVTLTRYTGRVIEVYKGTGIRKGGFEFCGYSGLIDYGSYVVGFDGYSTEKLPYFGLDAVFIEHDEGAFFRMLSYESHIYRIEDKRYLVLGVEQADLKEKLQRLASNAPLKP